MWDILVICPFPKFRFYSSWLRNNSIHDDFYLLQKGKVWNNVQLKPIRHWKKLLHDMANLHDPYTAHHIQSKHSHSSNEHPFPPFQYFVKRTSFTLTDRKYLFLTNTSWNWILKHVFCKREQNEMKVYHATLNPIPNPRRPNSCYSF